MFNLKKGNGLAWIIVVIAILIILFLVFRGGNTEEVNEEEMTEENEEVSATEENGIATVTYTNDGFSPQEITIEVGDTVRFVNESSREMWVGSAVHPTHEVFSGTSLRDHCPDLENDDFDQCEGTGNGTSWEFTFNDEGEWGYHNHLGASHFGRVIVE